MQNLSKNKAWPLVLHFKVARLTVPTPRDGLVYPSFVMSLSRRRLHIWDEKLHSDFFFYILFVLGNQWRGSPRHVHGTWRSATTKWRPLWRAVTTNKPLHGAAPRKLVQVWRSTTLAFFLDKHQILKNYVALHHSRGPGMVGHHGRRALPWRSSTCKRKKERKKYIYYVIFARGTPLRRNNLGPTAPHATGVMLWRCATLLGFGVGGYHVTGKMPWRSATPNAVLAGI